MQDAERYPEVVGQPYHGEYDAPKAMTDYTGTPTPSYGLPSHHSSPGPQLVGGDEGMIAVTDEGKIMVDDGTAGNQSGAGRRICGLKRKTFFILLVVAIIVVVGAVAGGVAGGLLANSSDDGDDSDSGDADSGEDSGSGSGDKDDITKEEVFRASDRAMAATRFQDDKVHLFYQDLKTHEIRYRMVIEGKAPDETTLDLDVDAMPGTSLAASSNGKEAAIYYVSEKDDKRSINQAIVECNDDSECKITSTNDITKDIKGNVHENSKLAAVWHDNNPEDIMRVYFQADDGFIFSLKGSKEGGWTRHDVITDNGYPGSGIVVAAPNVTTTSVFWVDNDTESLKWVLYADGEGSIPPSEDINPHRRSPWAPGSSLTGIHAYENDSPWRLFYADPKGGMINSFWRHTQPFLWVERNDKDVWGNATGGFAAVAWPEEARIYYFQDDELVMSKASGEDDWEPPVSLD